MTLNKYAKAGVEVILLLILFFILGYLRICFFQATSPQCYTIGAVQANVLPINKTLKGNCRFYLLSVSKEKVGRLRMMFLTVFSPKSVGFIDKIKGIDLYTDIDKKIDNPKEKVVFQDNDTLISLILKNNSSPTTSDIISISDIHQIESELQKKGYGKFLIALSDKQNLKFINLRLNGRNVKTKVQNERDSNITLQGIIIKKSKKFDSAPLYLDSLETIDYLSQINEK